MCERDQRLFRGQHARSENAGSTIQWPPHSSESGIGHHIACQIVLARPHDDKVMKGTRPFMVDHNLSSDLALMFLHMYPFDLFSARVSFCMCIHLI